MWGAEGERRCGLLSVVGGLGQWRESLHSVECGVGARAVGAYAVTTCGYNIEGRDPVGDCGAIQAGSAAGGLRWVLG